MQTASDTPWIDARLFNENQRRVGPLAGRHRRPRPIVLVSLLGPVNAVSQRATLDTAADDTVFPESVASAIGIELTGAPTGEAAGVGGAPAASPVGAPVNSM